MNITENIKKYMLERGINDRYTSYDFCYNYFHSFYERGCLEDIASSENIQMSCLQLGFYLGSWGMFRNSSLLGKSLKHYENIIHTISCMDKRLWNIDVDSYSDENIQILIDAKWEVVRNIYTDNYSSDTLATKTMLGVFGNVPALDTNFCKAFSVGKSLGKGPLTKIKSFYEKNKELIDSYVIKTLDFKTGIETHRVYTKAKIIDMIGFVEGSNPSGF